MALAAGLSTAYTLRNKANGTPSSVMPSPPSKHTSATCDPLQRRHQLPTQHNSLPVSSNTPSRGLLGRRSACSSARRHYLPAKQRLLPSSNYTNQTHRRHMAAFHHLRRRVHAKSRHVTLPRSYEHFALQQNLAPTKSATHTCRTCFSVLTGPPHLLDGVRHGALTHSPRPSVSNGCTAMLLRLIKVEARHAPSCSKKPCSSSPPAPSSKCTNHAYSEQSVPFSTA